MAMKIAFVSCNQTVMMIMAKQRVLKERITQQRVIVNWKEKTQKKNMKEKENDKYCVRQLQSVDRT